MSVSVSVFTVVAVADTVGVLRLFAIALAVLLVSLDVEKPQVIPEEEKSFSKRKTSMI